VIIVKSPLRISFVGGGSDLPSFFHEEDGCVVSTAIDKYVYLTVNPKYDGDVRVSYGHTTEYVSHARDVQHPLVREALRCLDIPKGVEIVSVADIPAGTGLGSSSSFTVGLLAALAAYQQTFRTADSLAHDAYQIERVHCRQAVGKQDQYAAAFGGLRCYTFHADERVDVEALALPTDFRAAFASHLLLLDTGPRHEASAILSDQNEAMRDSRKRADVRALANLAHAFRDALLMGDLLECGHILDAAWRLKRTVARGITSVAIDDWYAQALRAGAWGGKLCGAGGGGFLLLFAPPERHTAIRQAAGLRQVPICPVEHGVQVIYAQGGCS
jgi:D-glycero-alpha-D-manno-heptose-7-phosphate kinase